MAGRQRAASSGSVVPMLTKGFVVSMDIWPIGCDQCLSECIRFEVVSARLVQY